MSNWTLLGEAQIPGTEQMIFLYQGKDDFSIKLARGQELMNSRKHGSEDALGELPCRRLKNAKDARVLIGGLGMGFTLAAALRSVGEKAEVTVAELIPEVVEWNRGPLGDRSGRPLDDSRTRVYVGDVVRLLKQSVQSFDVIALDIDNGPEGLTRSSNNWLYSLMGVATAQKALRPRGVLAYWSAAPDDDFHDLLKSCGLLVDQVHVYAHGNKGSRHTLWLCSH
jgi:spermidine synthase